MKKIKVEEKKKRERGGGARGTTKKKQKRKVSQKCSSGQLAEAYMNLVAEVGWAGSRWRGCVAGRVRRGQGGQGIF